MNCTHKEQETCQVEKMGCEGCYYDDSKVKRAKKNLKEYLQYCKVNFNALDTDMQIIYEYIDKLEKRIKDLQEINDEHKKLNGELRKELTKDVI